MNSVWSLPPGQSPVSAGPAWQSQASPGHGITMPFAAGKGSGGGLAKCQAKRFPKVNSERKILSWLRQIPTWEPGAKGAEGTEDLAGTGCAEAPATVPGLGTRRLRSPRAGTGDVGTTMTAGRESVEGCHRRDSLRRRLGWI